MKLADDGAVSGETNENTELHPETHNQDADTTQSLEPNEQSSSSPASDHATAEEPDVSSPSNTLVEAEAEPQTVVLNDKEYRAFVHSLRGTRDPKALDRFAYTPNNPQILATSLRYTRQRMHIPSHPPKNIQRLSLLSKPLPHKQVTKQPSTMGHFGSFPTSTRKELPPLSQEEQQRFERLSVVREDRRRTRFKPAEPLTYDKRHLPPLTGHEAQKFERMSKTLSICGQAKVNMKYTDLVKPYVLQPAGKSAKNKK
jgi:hypothetical protein